MITRVGRPVLASVWRKPSPMARTETRTPTTPAMPTTTTSDVPSRLGMFRRLMSVTWTTWFSQDIASAARERVHDAQPVHAQRGRQPDGQRERELLLRRRLRLVGGVHERPVDVRRDGLGLVDVRDADDVPAGLALPELARLVELGHVDQHDLGVGADGRVLGVEDADQVELPVEAAVGLRVDLRGDRQPLADLPAIAVGQPLAGDGARTRLDERLALRRRDLELGVHVEVAGGIDHEDGEGVALVLVLGAEPVRVRHAHHTRHALDPRRVRHRQRLDDGVARGGEQPLGVRAVGARLERHLHGLEQPEEQEGDEHGEHREHRARLLAEELGPEQRQVSHDGAWPLVAASVPLSRRRRRRAYSAAFGSWVTITMVLPWSSLSIWSSSRISWAVARSRSPVGSSQTSSVGSETIARAIATRCSWPPDSSLGLCAARSRRPTSVSAISAWRRRSAALSPVSSSGSSTTTRSPARRPLVISRSAPTVWPGVTLRRSTLPSTYTKTLPSLRTASTGTRTPDATGAAGVVDAAPRNATRTPMSGTMRGSFEGIAMRTLTVALLRSAVGMIAITEPGIFQSGYALSVASTGCSDATRLMNDSLTSTWISSESMSTMVPMPVRVKPPPAEIGEIISPGCAALAITMPVNGARITVLSSCTCATVTDSVATRICSWLAVSFARSVSRWARAASIACSATSFRLNSSCERA